MPPKPIDVQPERTHGPTCLHPNASRRYDRHAAGPVVGGLGVSMDDYVFRYQPICSAERCGEKALFKVAAPWSDGTSRELKNYGLACQTHRDLVLARAQLHRHDLALAEGETIGPVGLYHLVNGSRDAELARLPDRAH
ncbi:hypothetical protein EP7_000816 [Isosphaeraceae bacterium EP7]